MFTGWHLQIYPAYSHSPGGFLWQCNFSKEGVTCACLHLQACFFHSSKSAQKDDFQNVIIWKPKGAFLGHQKHHKLERTNCALSRITQCLAPSSASSKPVFGIYPGNTFLNLKCVSLHNFWIFTSLFRFIFNCFFEASQFQSFCCLLWLCWASAICV